MTEAHKYRQLAKDCIVWARIATSGDQRAYLLDLAKEWRSDAKELERAKASEMAGQETKNGNFASGGLSRDRKSSGIFAAIARRFPKPMIGKRLTQSEANG